MVVAPDSMSMTFKLADQSFSKNTWKRTWLIDLLLLLLKNCFFFFFFFVLFFVFVFVCFLFLFCFVLFVCLFVFLTRIMDIWKKDITYRCVAFGIGDVFFTRIILTHRKMKRQNALWEDQRLLFTTMVLWETHQGRPNDNRRVSTCLLYIWGLWGREGEDLGKKRKVLFTNGSRSTYVKKTSCQVL